jgi:hypothetical protein
MTDLRLQKQWRVTELLLRRAHSALPAPTVDVTIEFDDRIAQFHEYLNHNELGLAFEALFEAADLVDARGRVWADLKRAATMMNLVERLPDAHERHILALSRDPTRAN